MSLIDHRVDDKVSTAQKIEVCVHATSLLQALQRLPDVVLQICFNEDNHTMQVQYMTGEQTTGQFSMPTDCADEYPQPLAIEKPEVEITEQGSVLLPMIKAARVAVAQDELRPIMGTVCIDLASEEYAVVASDGHMLIADQHFRGAGYLKGQPQGVKLHKSILDTLLQAFGGVENLTIKATSQLVEIGADGGLQLVCRPIDAKYPNWRSVIPQNQPMMVTLCKDSLIQTVQRVALFSNDSSNLIRLQFNGTVLTIEAEDYDFQRTAHESLSLQDTNMTDNFAIGVKASTLLDVLSTVKTENIHLLLVDARHAMVIKEEDVNAKYTGLCMPMLLND